ncbi:MAG: nucleoside hydrolase [Pseudonocardiales bacterium]|nr:nucleoside hydrolase [Pseudonocardiales bacterium]MBV9652527.1 nucleoside hydrolase [Pseudonocardiales bacterium]
MTVPMIIDTDPGVDDAVAVLLAVASPRVQLLALTTVFGNAGVDVTTTNALRLRALSGLDQLPVAAGADRPLAYPRHPRASCWHGVDGLAGQAEQLPAPSGPISPLGAVPLMATLLRSAPIPVTLAAIGPLTNIALLLAVHPELKPRIERVVAMGGDFSQSQAEFNVGSDPEAARRVLVEEDVPTTLVPLDLTRRAVPDDTWLAELAAAGPRCAVLAGIIEAYRQQRRAPVALHDSLAVLEAAAPGTVRTTPRCLDVVCDRGPARGAVVSGLPGRHVQVAHDGDLASINATILNRLRRLE